MDFADSGRGNKVAGNHHLPECAFKQPFCKFSKERVYYIGFPVQSNYQIGGIVLLCRVDDAGGNIKVISGNWRYLYICRGGNHCSLFKVFLTLLFPLLNVFAVGDYIECNQRPAQFSVSD